VIDIGDGTCWHPRVKGLTTLMVNSIFNGSRTARPPGSKGPSPTLMGLVARLASPRTTRAGTDGLRDSPLEGAVCCELVSEMELAKPVFWDVDGKMDPFPQAVGHLNDWYYAYFSNARLAPAAHFPVYQRDLFKTSGFLVNYGSKAHDIGGLDRNDRHRSPYRLMAASRLMTSARAPQTLWRDEQPNPRTGNATSL